jgi:hypothetical protein
MAVDALPDELKLAYFEAGISKDTVIVMPSPSFDPFADMPAEQLRGWERFADFLVERQYVHPDGVVDHIEWLLRHDFKTPDEWLGDPGEQYRANISAGRRVGAWSMPAGTREDWVRFKSQKP